MELITELQNFMFLMNERVVAVQHSLGNPIVVEEKDDEEGVDAYTEYFAPPVIPEDGVLCEIDEDKRRDGLPEYEE